MMSPCPINVLLAKSCSCVCHCRQEQLAAITDECSYVLLAVLLGPPLSLGASLQGKACLRHSATQTRELCGRMSRQFRCCLVDVAVGTMERGVQMRSQIYHPISFWSLICSVSWPRPVIDISAISWRTTFGLGVEEPHTILHPVLSCKFTKGNIHALLIIIYMNIREHRLAQLHHNSKRLGGLPASNTVETPRWAETNSRFPSGLE